MYVNGTFVVSGLPKNPYWKVYLNTASGNFLEAIIWNLPPGGESEGGINYGFDDIEDTTIPVYSDVGSQFWEVTDINGDGTLDLVVFSENQGYMYYTHMYFVYGLPDTPHWKVYLGPTTVLGVPVVEENSPIRIFPNPTTAITIVKIEEKLLGNNYQLFNNLGQLIDKGTLRNLETKLDLTKQPNGVYYLSVGDGLGYSAKIVKHK